MAQLTFTIADGKLTVGSAGRTNDYSSTDYRAKAWRNGSREGVRVFPLDGDESKPRWSAEEYQDVALNIDGIGVSPASVDDFVAKFNAACGTNIGYNTQYPQHIISDTVDLDTSNPTQLTTIAKAGYLTISAPDSNTGVVYVGDEDVNNTSYQLDIGKDVFMELDNLAKIYAYTANPADIVTILGAYKY